MIVQILSGRKEQYKFVEAMYQGKAEFFYYANWEQSEAAETRADVILVDPELTVRDSYTAVQVKRWMAEGNPLLICAPDRRKSLVRELKSVGIEPGAPIPEEPVRPGLEQEEEGVPEGPVRPAYRNVFGIVELTRDADAGMITMMMAEELASEMQEDHGLVTVFAPEHPCFYYSLGLESKFGETGFQRVEEYVRCLSEKEEVNDSGKVPNLLEGISWLTAAGYAEKEKSHDECAKPHEEPENTEYPEHGAPFACSENRGASACAENTEHLSEAASADNSRVSVIRQLQGNVLLCCYSAKEFAREVREAAGCLDAVLVIAGARPSSLMEGAEHLRMIRESGLPVFYAVSHVNRSARRPLISQILETEDIIWLSEIDSAVLYEAEYAQENPYRFEEIRRMMMPPVSQMIEALKASGKENAANLSANEAQVSVNGD